MRRKIVLPNHGSNDAAARDKVKKAVDLTRAIGGVVTRKPSAEAAFGLVELPYLPCN